MEHFIGGGKLIIKRWWHGHQRIKKWASLDKSMPIFSKTHSMGSKKVCHAHWKILASQARLGNFEGSLSKA